MSSSPAGSRRLLLVEGALAGAFAGAVEARCALPAVHPPLLSISEWWGTWILAVGLTTGWGLLASSFVARTARGTRPSVHGLAVGLSLALPVLLRAFLSLRPGFGPQGRLPALAAASGLALLALAVPVFAFGLLRRRVLLGLGGAVALAATVSGALLAPVAPRGSTERPDRPPSLLLITLDTMRRDHLPPRGSFLPPDGFLETLQREAIAWKHLTAPIPLTGPSHASLLTGLPPRLHGAQDNGWPIGTEVGTLAQDLSGRGYVTGAVVSSAVLHRQLCGLEKGFDEYDDSFRPGTPRRRLAFLAAGRRLLDLLRGEATGLSHQRRAEETVDLGLRFLRRHPDRPFFLWLHFYDAHRPYQPLGPLPGWETLPPVAGEPARGGAGSGSTNGTPTRDGDDYWTERARYAGEIKDVDRALTRLMRRFQSDPRRSTTILVAVTDHGESFGTHGRGYRFDHGAYLFEDELHLAAWWREPASSSENTAWLDSLAARPQGMDAVGRALRRRLGLAPVDTTLPGPSGFSLSHSTVAGDTLWFCLRRPTRKLLLARCPSGRSIYEAYDLARDPQEQENLLPGRRAPHGSPASARGFADGPLWKEDEAILENWAASILEGLRQPRPRLSESAKARLRSLGYLR